MSLFEAVEGPAFSIRLRFSVSHRRDLLCFDTLGGGGFAGSGHSLATRNRVTVFAPAQGIECHTNVSAFLFFAIVLVSLQTQLVVPLAPTINKYNKSMQRNMKYIEQERIKNN